MAPEEPASAAIKLSDLVEAFEFVSFAAVGEHHAYICRRTGKIIFSSEMVEIEENDLPEDLDDSMQYQEVPHRREFDLGKRLALSFVEEEIPGYLLQVREMFSRRGAYGRFKQLLQTNGIIEKWYAFEQSEIETVLKAWCDEVGINLIS
jgi:hypothetical protein